MKFPHGEGSAVIHRKKNDLLYKDVTFWQSFSVFFSFFSFLFFYRNLLNSSSTRFLVVLFCLAFSTAPFSSKNFFLGLIVRSSSTQIFFWVVFLLLLLSVTAVAYVGLISLFWVRPFHTLYLSHLPPRSFLEGLSSEQFAELGPVQLLAFSARACSLAFLPSASPFLTIWRAVFIYLVLLGGCVQVFLSLVIPLISAILRAQFSYFSQGFFMRLLLWFSSFWFCSF